MHSQVHYYLVKIKKRASFSFRQLEQTIKEAGVKQKISRRNW